MNTKINYAKYYECLMALREKTEKLLLGTDNENLVIKMSEELTLQMKEKNCDWRLWVNIVQVNLILSLH